MRKRQLFGLVSAMALSQFAGGQVTTWTNQSGDNSWANPVNWNNGVPTASGEALVPLVTTQIDLGGSSHQVGLLRFSGVNSASLSNGSLTLDELFCDDTSFLSVNANLVAAGPDLAIRSASPNVPRVLGNIDNAAIGNTNLRLMRATLGGEVRTTGTVTVSTKDTSLQPTARFTAASQLTVLNGILVLNDTPNAIPDSIPVQLTNGVISAFPLAIDIIERVGSLSISGSVGFMQAPFTPAPKSFVFTGQSFARDDFSVLSIIRPSVGTLTVKFDTPIPNFGAGALPTQRGMLPWATITDAGTSRETALATYDAGVDLNDPADDIGFRPLHPELEQRSTFVGTTPLENVRIAANTTLSNSAEIQSLTLSNLESVASFSTLALTLNAPLKIRSGALLATGTASLVAKIDQIDGTGQIDTEGDAYISGFRPGSTNQLRILVPVNAERVAIQGVGVRLSDVRAQKILVQGGAVVDSTTAAEIDLRSGTLSLPMGFGGLIRYGRDARSLTTGTTTLNASVFFEPLTDEQLRFSHTRNIRLAPVMTGNFTGGGTLGGGGFRHDGNANWDSATVASGGTVELNGTWRATSGDLILNQSDGTSPRATLIGTGTFLGEVYGGTIDPGSAIGRFTVDSFFARGQNSRLSFTLAGTLPVAQYDQLTVLDVLSLEAGADRAASLQVSQQFNPAVGDSFLLVDNQSLAPIRGNFLGLPEGASFTRIFTTYALTYSGGDGNDIVITVTSTIPEPAVVFAIGAVGALRRWRAPA